MDLIKQLQEIGLDGKKAQVYLGLLRLHEAAAQPIAKEAGVERTTVYKILHDLTQTGLATKIIKGKRISYLANPVPSLKTFLTKKENLLQAILPMLMAAQGDKKSRPRVRFYDNLESIRQVLLDSLECKEKLRRDYAFVENVVEFLGLRFIQNQINARVKRGLKVRSLRPLSTTPEKDWFIKSENKDVLREVRYLKPTVQFEPLIMIYDNIAAVISSKKESYALVIESAEFAQAMKTLFDIAWAGGKDK